MQQFRAVWSDDSTYHFAFWMVMKFYIDFFHRRHLNEHSSKNYWIIFFFPMTFKKLKIEAEIPQLSALPTAPAVLHQSPKVSMFPNLLLIETCTRPKQNLRKASFPFLCSRCTILLWQSPLQDLACFASRRKWTLSVFSTIYSPVFHWPLAKCKENNPEKTDDQMWPNWFSPVLPLKFCCINRFPVSHWEETRGFKS